MTNFITVSATHDATRKNAREREFKMSKIIERNDAQKIRNLKSSFTRNINERIKFELAKLNMTEEEALNDTSANTVKKLRKYQAEMNHDALFAALVELKQDSFDYMNSSMRANSRCNVYAIEKNVFVAKDYAKVYSSSSAKKVHENTLAILRNLHAMRDKIEAKQAKFNRSLAYSSLSKFYRHENEDAETISALVTRRVQAISTASTQTSSTFRLLAALNVCFYSNSDNQLERIDYDHKIFTLI